MGAIGIALSGMQAASLRFDVAANDVANSSTPGFPPGGPGAQPAEQPSGTDLITELTTLVNAPIAYAANASVVCAYQQASSTLLDTYR